MTVARWRSRAFAVAIASIGVACGTHVTVGVVGGPPDATATLEGGSRGAPAPAPSSFGDASARREASTPTLGCDEVPCGDPCIPCAPDAAFCPPPEVFHVCSALGTCAPTNPYCLVVKEDAGGADWSACVGLRCGDRCSPCDPESTSCGDAGDAYVCQADGTCRDRAATCR